MSLFETKLEIPIASAGAINDVLLENELGSWSLLEDVIVQRAWLVGIFASTEEAELSCTELLPLLPVAPGARVLRELGDAEWRDSYKLHFRPWAFGRLHWVPIWERETYPLPDGHAALWLDPGLAFGTGNHESTRLCVERLVAIAENRGTSGRVVDAGCGSGILALSAARLGFRGVSGFDNDPDAVRVSWENAELNGLSSEVDFRTADLVSGLAGVQAQVVMANILADVLVKFGRDLTNSVAPGGILVLSGILTSECADVRGAFRAIAPTWAQESRSLGDWADVLMIRPAS